MRTLVESHFTAAPQPRRAPGKAMQRHDSKPRSTLYNLRGCTGLNSTG